MALEGNGTTTLGANVVVRGQGNVGTPALSGGTNNLVNNGRISADVNLGTLNIVPGAGNGAVTNNGLIDARNGGTLNLAGVNVSNAAGVIDARNGSVVLQSGSNVIGGTISSAGTGVFRANSNGGNFLTGVTISGVVDLSNAGNARERVVNNLTLLGGSVNVANGGILSIDNATFGAAQAIGGNGTINLNDAGARLAFEGNFSTTLGANVVVRGQGNIGIAAFSGGTNNLVNNGRIAADVSGGTLNITPGAGNGNLTNNGILEATAGGTLQLSTNVVGNTGSQILAGAGSQVVQNGVTVSGVINTSGAGSFAAVSSNSNFLDGITLNGTLDLTSAGNSRERVINGLTLNGNVNVANGGILSLDSANTAGGNQSLTGTGTINLNDGGARLALEGNGTATLGANILVRGQGNIGTPLFSGGTNNLVNQGTIHADGGTLTISPDAGNGGFTNDGLALAPAPEYSPSSPRLLAPARCRWTLVAW